MSRSILRLFLSLLMCFCLVASGDATEQRLVDASHNKCAHGLHPQPNHGPFSVFLFCDDALGSNIGIVLTERGAGPGNLRLNDMKAWQTWEPVNRFWQDRTWATDVTNFAWGPSQRYLYIATSSIYGDGGFFKLDLREHTYQRLMPSSDVPYKGNPKYGVETEIQQV